jgi:hypothetical protein
MHTHTHTHTHMASIRNDTVTNSKSKRVIADVDSDDDSGDESSASKKRPAPEPTEDDEYEEDEVMSEDEQLFPPSTVEAKRQESAATPIDTPKSMQVTIRAVALPTGVCATYDAHGFVAIRPKEAGDAAPDWLRAVQVKTTDGKTKMFAFIAGADKKTVRAVGYLTVNVNAAFTGFPMGTALKTTAKKPLGDIQATESGFVRRLPSAVVDGVEVTSSDDWVAMCDDLEVGHDIAFGAREYTKAKNAMQNAGFAVQHHLAAPVLCVGGSEGKADVGSVKAVEKINKLELTITDRVSGNSVTASLWTSEAVTFFGVDARFLDADWFKKRRYVLYLSPSHIQESNGRYNRPYTLAAVARIRLESEPSYVMKAPIFKSFLKKKVVEINRIEPVQQSGKKAPPQATKQQRQVLRDGGTLPIAFFDTDSSVDACVDVRKARQFVRRETKEQEQPKETSVMEWLSELDGLLSQHDATFNTVKKAFVGDNPHKSALFKWMNVHQASVDDLTFGERVYYRKNPNSEEKPDKKKPSSSSEDWDDEDDTTVAIIM